MIHLVFNAGDVDLMQKVVGVDQTLTGEVLQIKDDYGVGPLHALETEEGRAARKQWWREVLAGGDYERSIDDDGIDDFKMLSDLSEKMRHDSSEIIWIWCAQNVHDVSGYYWLLKYLKEFSGRIFILYLNNLPFINDKGGIFYPEWLYQIPVKEFLKAKKLARPVSLSEFETDPDEWTKLADEHPGVRSLEGGKKLIQHEYSFYDAELKKFVGKDFQKVSKIIRDYYNKSKLLTGDAYLLWRLKAMAAKGTFDIQGEMKGMKDFELRLKSNTPEN